MHKITNVVKAEPKTELEDWQYAMNNFQSTLVKVFGKKIKVTVANENDWSYSLVDHDNKKVMAVF